MKSLVAKPVFTLSCAVLLAAGCSVQTSQKDIGNRRDTVTPVAPAQSEGRLLRNEWQRIGR